MIETALFVILAVVTTVTAVLVIVQRNPVSSAIYLIITFFCLAGVYLLLQAEFIAVIQVLVYAGAIMVLFLFVIMLLNLEKEKRLVTRNRLQKVVGVFLGAVLLFQIGMVFRSALLRFSFLDGAKGNFPPEKVAAPGQYPGGGPASIHRFSSSLSRLPPCCCSWPSSGPSFWPNARSKEGAKMVSLSSYLILSAILFSIGVVGFLLRRNTIVIFMSIELMLNAANLAFVAFSRFLNSMDGQIIVVFVMPWPRPRRPWAWPSSWPCTAPRRPSMRTR